MLTLIIITVIGVVAVAFLSWAMVEATKILYEEYKEINDDNNESA